MSGTQVRRGKNEAIESGPRSQSLLLKQKTVGPKGQNAIKTPITTVEYFKFPIFRKKLLKRDCRKIPTSVSLPLQPRSCFEVTHMTNHPYTQFLPCICTLAYIMTCAYTCTEKPLYRIHGGRPEGPVHAITDSQSIHYLSFRSINRFFE